MNSVAEPCCTNDAMGSDPCHPVDALGTRLALLRQQRRLGEAELAAAVGISRQRLKKIENNTVSPPVDLLHRLLTILQCSPNRLLSMPAANVSHSWRALDRADSNKARHVLANELSQKAMSPEVIRLAVAEELLVKPDGELFLIVLQGQLRWLGTDRAESVLGIGDSAYLKAGPCGRVVAGQQGAELLTVLHP